MKVKLYECQPRTEPCGCSEVYTGQFRRGDTVVLRLDTGELLCSLSLFPDTIFRRKKSNPEFLLYDYDNEYLVHGTFGLGCTGRGSKYER